MKMERILYGAGVRGRLAAVKVVVQSLISRSVVAEGGSLDDMSAWPIGIS